MISVQDYFENYGKASLGNSPYQIADYYSQDFIAADPSGCQAYKNDESFIKWLEGVIQFNKQSGMRDMKLLNVTTTHMGDNYLTAKVTWGAVFSKQPDKVIPFDITYTLHKETDSYKIILYVSHERQEAAMRKNGIL